MLIFPLRFLILYPKAKVDSLWAAFSSPGKLESQHMTCAALSASFGCSYIQRYSIEQDICSVHAQSLQKKCYDLSFSISKDYSFFACRRQAEKHKPMIDNVKALNKAGHVYP